MYAGLVAKALAFRKQTRSTHTVTFVSRCSVVTQAQKSDGDRVWSMVPCRSGLTFRIALTFHPQSQVTIRYPVTICAATGQKVGGNCPVFSLLYSFTLVTRNTLNIVSSTYYFC